MESPLQGQGAPSPETTAVYVSVYLDRLLAVDDINYRWQAVFMFYLTWRDPSAANKIAERTAQALNGSSSCSYPCSNFVRSLLCCDSIFIPSFYFRNAFGFPQDREVGYTISATSWGAVIWSVYVHGQWYQPMSFQHFPFDSMDLLMELEFVATHNLPKATIDKNGTEVYHPGVEVIFSSEGTNLYSIGRGDDSAQWSVDDIYLESYQVDTGAFFQAQSQTFSDKGDPAPLNPAPGTFDCSLVGLTGEGCNVLSGRNTTLFGIYIQVTRFWRYQLLNTVLPVLLCGLLGCIVFFLSKEDLASRLTIIVTLFLALTAVQFVLSDKQPQSSYVTPTQQLIIATYVFLSVIALESILVHHIGTWPRQKLVRRKRKEGWRKYRQLMAAQKQAKRQRQQGQQGSNGASELPISQGPPLSAAPGASEAGGAAGQVRFAEQQAQQEEEEEEEEEEEGQEGKEDMASRQPMQPRIGLLRCFASPETKRPPAPSRSTTATQLAMDEAFSDYVGHQIDVVLAWLLLLGYCLAAILIFSLQNGYIDLFTGVD